MIRIQTNTTVLYLVWENVSRVLLEHSVLQIITGLTIVRVVLPEPIRIRKVLRHVRDVQEDLTLLRTVRVRTVFER